MILINQLRVSHLFCIICSLNVVFVKLFWNYIPKSWRFDPEKASDCGKQWLCRIKHEMKERNNGKNVSLALLYLVSGTSNYQYSHNWKGHFVQFQCRSLPPRPMVRLFPRCLERVDAMIYFYLSRVKSRLKSI